MADYKLILKSSKWPTFLIKEPLVYIMIFDNKESMIIVINYNVMYLYFCHDKVVFYHFNLSLFMLNIHMKIKIIEKV